MPLAHARWPPSKSSPCLCECPASRVPGQEARSTGHDDRPPRPVLLRGPWGADGLREAGASGLEVLGPLHGSPRTTTRPRPSLFPAQRQPSWHTWAWGQPCWARTSSPSIPASHPRPPHCFPDPRPLSPGLQAWQGPPRAVPPSSAFLASSSGSSSSPLVTEPPSSSPSVLPHLSACIHLGPQLFSGNYCVPGSVSEQEMGEGLVPPPRQELGSAQNDSVESQVCQAGCLEEVSHSIAQGGVLLRARQEGISSREVGRSV